MQVVGARARWAIVALTLVTIVARLWGIGYGVPCWEEPDADIPGHVDRLHGDVPLAGIEHPDQQYPHLIADIARWLPSRPAASDLGASASVGEHLAAAAHTHLMVRIVVALLSALAVPLTFSIARRFVEPAWALFAAALIAASLLHQSFAQQARPHGVVATFCALAVLADLRLVRKPSLASYFAAGLAAALAVGSLHSGIAVLIPGLVAHTLACGGWRRIVEPKLLVPVALVAVAVALFYPFLFGATLDGAQEQAAVVEGAVQQAEHSVSWRQFDGRGFVVVARVLWSYEPALVLLCLAAAITAVAGVLEHRVPSSDRRDVWVVLSFALPYLLAIGLFERTYERFVLPLLPFAACFAAWGASHWSTALPRARRAVAVLAVLTLGVPALAVGKLAWLRSRPDTLDQVARWIETSPDARGERVYLWASPPPLDVPLARVREGLLLNGKVPRVPLTPWTAWQAALPREVADALAPRRDLHWLSLPRAAGARPDLAAHIASLAPALFVIEVFETRTHHPLRVELREALRASGECLARFSPDRDAQSTELELFFQLSDHYNEEVDVAWPNFTRRLLGARAIGPVVEIWRVPRL